MLIFRQDRNFLESPLPPPPPKKKKEGNIGKAKIGKAKKRKVLSPYACEQVELAEVHPTAYQL